MENPQIRVGGKTYLVTVEDASWVGTIILIQDAGLIESADWQEPTVD